MKDNYTIHRCPDKTKSVFFLLSGCFGTQSGIGNYYTKIIEKLNKEGVTCVTMDVAGNGERYLESVDTYTQDRDDVIRVYNKIKNMDEFKDVNFEIMGYSLGALTALQVINALPENSFSKFIAQCPSWHKDDLKELVDSNGFLPNLNRPINESEFHMYHMDINAVLDLQRLLDDKYFIYESLSKVDGPISILIGENDEEIHKDFFYKYFKDDYSADLSLDEKLCPEKLGDDKKYENWLEKTIKNLDIQLVEIEDSDHTMNLFNPEKTNSEEIMKKCIDANCNFVLEKNQSDLVL